MHAIECVAHACHNGRSQCDARVASVGDAVGPDVGAEVTPGGTGGGLGNGGDGGGGDGGGGGGGDGGGMPVGELVGADGPPSTITHVTHHHTPSMPMQRF